MKTNFFYNNSKGADNMAAFYQESDYEKRPA